MAPWFSKTICKFILRIKLRDGQKGRQPSYRQARALHISSNVRQHNCNLLLSLVSSLISYLLGGSPKISSIISEKKSCGSPELSCIVGEKNKSCDSPIISTIAG